jgi:hypothetical protein
LSSSNEDSTIERSNDSDTSIDNNETVEESNNNKKNHVEQELEQKELSKKKLHIVWRRGKVLEMLSDGVTNQSTIADTLRVSEGLIHQDIYALKAEAKERIRLHLQERLPFIFETCLVRLEKTKREAIDIYTKAETSAIKLKALTLINDTTAKILDIVTHNDIVLNAMDGTNKIVKQFDTLRQKAQYDDGVIISNYRDAERSKNDSREEAATDDNRESEPTATEQDTRVF